MNGDLEKNLFSPYGDYPQLNKKYEITDEDESHIYFSYYKIKKNLKIVKYILTEEFRYFTIFRVYIDLKRTEHFYYFSEIYGALDLEKFNLEDKYDRITLKQEILKK